MTKVICDLTGCKYNSSCCTSPAEDKECYCTKDSVKLEIDPEMCQLDCSMFEESTDKDVECRHCQIEKYGGIRLSKEVKFEDCTSTDFKF